MRNSASTTFATDGKNCAEDRDTASTFRLQCVVCSQPSETSNVLAATGLACPECKFVLSEVNGIFRCLAPDRELHFEQFVREYELVRSGEGRGSSSADYYLELPFKDLTGRNGWQWRIRARTWRHVERHLLPEIERSYPKGCDVLDIGAGNCWLSFRLALRGHRPVAIDLLDNDADGLGAARHYFDHVYRPFPRFQAEMDRLPFAPEQFDIAIFNASLHYSVDYELTLLEALRCLRRPGHVIILDSPFYWCDESGQTMVQEKRAAFQRQFGFRSDSIPSREYLTKKILDGLGTKLLLEWKFLKPWYGWSWALRPAKARLLRRREPSKFFLIWAEAQK
jgi:ubiquinone/menaquinone biosynthesis C-methylase UbiE